jgi:chitin disaccharide deacetylase
MASGERRRRLIVTADDFGASASINQAVFEAHHKGVLTCASLMVNGDAFDEAIEIARLCPNLGVGLHLVLSYGRAALGMQEVPDLLKDDGTFRRSAVGAGFAYYFSQGLKEQLSKEIAAQFEKFVAAGLRMDHVNGHLHFHMHPTVLALLIPEMKQRGVRTLRVTNEPIAIDSKIAGQRQFYRWSHWMIFNRLSARARPMLLLGGFAHTARVFGLLQDSRITEDYLLKLIPELPPGDSEIYAHPSLEEFSHEYLALVSPKVKAAIHERGIELVRYQDL